MSGYRPTHSDLVDRAATWLQNSAVIPRYFRGSATGKSRKVRCGVVLVEHHGGVGKEIPDAIGWYQGQFSILVECKTSRSDFLRDLKKTRTLDSKKSVGKYRYYMAAPGIIQPDEIPGGWGLIEVHPQKCRVVRLPAANRGYSSLIETSMLLSELRLWQIAASGAPLKKSARASRILQALEVGYRVWKQGYGE